MKTLRIEIIKSKLTQLETALDFINENTPDDVEEFKSSKLIKNAVYKEVEFAVELLIDICAIINSDLKLGMPEVEDNLLDNLGKNKIFNKETISLIREMKSFRNVLVHKYGDIDDEVSFQTIKEGMKDFKIAGEEIKRVVGKFEK